MPAHIVLPWVHRVFSNLKRWALGVYQLLPKKHLQTYLDEFVFRFNRRKNRAAGFVTLLRNAVQIPGTTYKMLIEAESAGISHRRDIHEQNTNGGLVVQHDIVQ